MKFGSDSKSYTKKRSFRQKFMTLLPIYSTKCKLYGYNSISIELNLILFPKFCTCHNFRGSAQPANACHAHHRHPSREWHSTSADLLLTRQTSCVGLNEEVDFVLFVAENCPESCWQVRAGREGLSD